MAGERTEETFHPIDIKEVISSKNPRLVKKLPSFVFRWLTKLLHLDELNQFISENCHLEPIEFLRKGIIFLGVEYEAFGIENIPKDRRFIAVSNHPLGGLDGVVLLKIINENTGTSKSLINDFLLAIKPLRKLSIPINKVGGQARNAIEEVEKLYQSTDNIVMFPAGLCSRKVDGEIVDLTWQKHFIQRAIKHQMDILPVHFDGRNTNRFYNLARIRKFLGIKFNFEMIFLADEMFKHKGKKFVVHIGEPISYTAFDKSKKHIEWAQYVKDIVYQLGKKS